MKKSILITALLTVSVLSACSEPATMQVHSADNDRLSNKENPDFLSYNHAAQLALESGSTKKWYNGENGHHGTIRPQTRYRSLEGRTCRDYSQTVYVDKKSHVGHGIACREPNGTWKISQ